MFVDNAGIERIESPFKIEEWVEIYLVVMFNIVIIQKTIGKHVMSIVFGRPPTERQTSNKACKELSEYI